MVQRLVPRRRSVLLLFLHYCALLTLRGVLEARTRKYYIAAQEVIWDYAGGDPLKRNLLDPDDQKSADKFFKASSQRVGSEYKKALYFEYTDSTFQTRKPKPKYLGLLGPTIRAEVEDALEITFFNNASREYSLHPHGMFYLKDGESALYLDGTSGRFKKDDVVAPGETVVMIWNVTESDAPGPKDPDCIPWVYHSHINTPRDTNAGLIGALITCRQGVLDENNERTDVDHDYPLLVKIFDENTSWLSLENAKRCLALNLCSGLAEQGDEDYISSNYMASINGLMYGHLRGIEACIGERAVFYVLGLGDSFDVHSLHFHGQELDYQLTKGDTISVFSATFVAAETTPTISGYWRITDMVDDNEKNGIGAFWRTKNCRRYRSYSSDTPRRAAGGTVRRYYIAAEETIWDYGPTGIDDRTGTALTDPTSESHTFFESNSERVGGKYRKAVFVQYKNANFRRKVPRSRADEYLGILGPILRASPGDLLKITVANHIRYPVSLLPHGLLYSSRQEKKNAYQASGSSGGSIAPGGRFTYRFRVPDDILDGSNEPCRHFIYTSAHDPTKDHNTGLVGPLLICRRGFEPPENSLQRFLLLTIFDENQSLFLQDNIANLTVDLSDEEFHRSNLMFSINGFSFANLPELGSCLGQDITWYVMSLGSDLDVHAISFDGNTFTERGKHRDVEGLVAGSTAVLNMTPDNQGRWIVESHTHLAQTNGMYGFYRVDSDCGQKEDLFNASGIVRKYFIAAVEIEWDYAPLERNSLTGRDLNDPRTEGNIFIRDDEYWIGDVYKKAVFREYTDETFTTEKSRRLEDKHLYILGPAIWAETGDIIEIKFKNLASRPYSMHAHGVQYDADNSGLNYATNQPVEPGSRRSYTWKVPGRSGPGMMDPNCIPWLYFSAVDPEKDMNSGLVGSLVICRKGTLAESGRGRSDVDREFFVLMNLFDENLSWYIEDNIHTYAPKRIGTDYESDEEFQLSNSMHAMNGRVYGNMFNLVMPYNSTVAWYFLSIGTQVDLHTFHIHGHTILHTTEGHREDAIAIFPGMAESLEMIADNPGTWLLHCHVNDHILDGMEAVYTVLKPGQSMPSEEPSC